MYKVKFDTGQTVDFQNQPTDADIEEVVKKLGIKPKSASIPEEPQKQSSPGYFSRVASKYQQAGQDITEATKTAMEPGGIAPLKGARLGLRTAGAVAGSVFAPITELPGIKQGLDLASTGIEKLSETKPIKALGDLFSPIAEVALKYPEATKDINDAINIAMVAYAGKTKPVKGEPKILAKAGQKLETQAGKVVEQNKQNFLEKLVRPEQTKAIKEAQVGRTSEVGTGIFKKSKITPTAQEANSIKAVSEIPNVSAKNTYQQNFNIIKDYNVKQAEKLVSDISKNDFAIPKKETISRLNKAKITLSESPTITGDAVKTADKLLAKANKLVLENDGTGSGLLKVRKAYDAWVETQRPNVFDAKAENAFTLANREVRNTLNTLLDEKAPNLGIKQSLQKQSALYNAMDNIKPKAAFEADSAIGRVFDRVGETLGIKNKVVQGAATVAGIGGLGAAATFAPFVAQLGGAYVVYRAGKWVLRAEARKAIGQVLQKYGNIIPATDKELLKGLVSGGAINIKNKVTE
jgi:hypothetical protein